jgi:hypothetical protein
VVFDDLQPETVGIGDEEVVQAGAPVGDGGSGVESRGGEEVFGLVEVGECQGEVPR